MVLRALEGGPLRLAELRRATGLPAQTTLRGHLATLVELGAVERQPGSEMPFAVENRLTPMGHDLLAVATLLEEWLARAPGRPISLESGSAKGVIKALVDGWGSTILQVLASHPTSLTELDRGIDALSYPAIERRLSSLRLAGLVEPMPSAGGSTPYTLTEWGRRGVVPLVAAGYCETAHPRSEVPPVTRFDVEAAFMMAMPLAELPVAANGSCRIEVEADGSRLAEGAEVTVRTEAGTVVACDADEGSEAVAFAAGSPEAWLTALGEGAFERLQLGGTGGLAERIVSGLHAALAGP